MARSLGKERLFIFVFWVAASILVAGFLLYLQSPKKSLNFENEHLGDWTRTVLSEESKEVVWYNPGEFNAYSKNLTILASVLDLDKEIRLHVLNETEFNDWNGSTTVRDSLISQNLTNNQVLRLRVEQHTTYHFIFENVLNATLRPRLSISVEGYFLRYDYSLLPFSPLLVFCGLFLMATTRRNALKPLDDHLRNWSSRKYRMPSSDKHLDEEKIIEFEAYSVKKRLLKYFVGALALILGVVFLNDLVAAYMVASSWDPVRPEYNVLLFDMAVRNVTLGAFVLAPLALGVILLFLVVSPRLEDTSRMILAKLGMGTQSEKHRRISKLMTEGILEKAVSLRFLVLCAILLSPLLLLNQFGLLNYFFLPYGTTLLAIIATWIGFVSWSTFHQACSTLGIGEYAKKTYMKAESVEYLISGFAMPAFISPFIIFASSDFWQSFLHDNVVAPALMLQQWPEIIVSGSDRELIGLQGILLICLAYIVLGGLFFILFPYIYREGRHGVSIAGITFGLTFLTEWVLSATFQEIAGTVFQPLALVAPVLASLVSWVTQRRYHKAVRKLIKKDTPH